MTYNIWSYSRLGHHNKCCHDFITELIYSHLLRFAGSGKDDPPYGALNVSGGAVYAKGEKATASNDASAW